MRLPAPAGSSPAADLDDYTTFCIGLRQICGIDLTQYRRPQMERRLRTYFERQGAKTLSECLGGLREDPTALDALLDRVTINVSQLWRHPGQIAHLQAAVLPELAQTGRVRIWSAGSSYGAEAYTLAAVCRTTIPRATVTILGTDIDRRMIERAKQGRFSLDDARGVPDATILKGFERVENGWQAREELRRLTQFELGDLLRIRPKAAAHDLVVCRNTVIYFSDVVRDDLHRRLVESLRPGGYLLVGATERVNDPAGLGLQTTAPFFYRKAT